MDEVLSEKKRVFGKNVDLSSAPGLVNQEMVEDVKGSDYRAELAMEIVSEKEGIASENVNLSSGLGSVNREVVDNLGGSDNQVALEMEIVSQKDEVISEKVDLSYGHGSGYQEMVEHSRGSDNQVAFELTTVIKPVEEGSENKDLIHPNMTSKVLEEELKVKGLEDDKPSSCVIDVRADESSDLEWVCRICHLTSDQSLETTSSTSSNERELIQLGCGCKDELGVAHSYCAEAWFKLKGNRLCEICGETAKNITGIADNRFMEEWNIRMFSGHGIQSSERSRGSWRGQPFCNFLLACLVIAFVLPWFFPVNMYY